MSTSWKVIPLTEAAAHPLYGVKNWLAVFAFGVLMVPLREFSELNRTAHDMGMTMSQLLALNKAFGAYTTFILAFEVAMAVSIYWLLFTKHRSFRLVASCLLLAIWPLFLAVAFVTDATEAGGALGKGILPWAISCAIWVTYLNRSRRVRVTFEQAIRVDLPASRFADARNGPINASNEPRQTPSNHTTRATFSLQKDALTGYQISQDARLPGHTLESSHNHGADPSEEAWATALAEFEGPARRPGLWARSFAGSTGNEAAAKAAYLGHRAAEVQNELHRDLAERLCAQEQDRQRQAESVRNAQEQEIRCKLANEPGRCPNGSCNALIPLSSQACAKCGAIFEPGSVWRVIPVQET